MNYKLEIVIDLPRERVIALLDNTDIKTRWQPDLISYSPVSGESGTVGAKSRLLYKLGRREVEMIETITERQLPDLFTCTYEANGVWNEVVNRFSESDPDKTLWSFETKFKCRGFMSIMSALMPGVFKKQSIKYMREFKQFAERESAT